MMTNYDFNSLTPGSVNGQDGWSSANAAQVATTPIDGPRRDVGPDRWNRGGAAAFAGKAFLDRNSDLVRHRNAYF